MAPKRSEPDFARGAAGARRVLREEGYEHLGQVDLDDFARLRGVTVRDFALAGCEGRLVRSGARGILSVSTSVRYASRRRFVIAHELGHFEIHKDRSNLELASCSEREISERYDEGPEQEANSFAVELLMPTTVWGREVAVPEPSFEPVEALADRFKVSFTAAAIRFVKLSPERCACVAAKNGVVGWVARSPSFEQWLPGGVKVQPGSLASRYFRKRELANGPEFVARSCWLDGDKALGELLEDVRVIGSDTTLSLLWVPASDDDEEEDSGDAG